MGRSPAGKPSRSGDKRWSTADTAVPAGRPPESGSATAERKRRPTPDQRLQTQSSWPASHLILRPFFAWAARRVCCFVGRRNRNMKLKCSKSRSASRGVELPAGLAACESLRLRQSGSVGIHLLEELQPGRCDGIGDTGWLAQFRRHLAPIEAYPTGGVFPGPFDKLA